MPDKNLTKTELLQFLRLHDIAAIATVSAKGTAHVTTAFFYVEDDFHFYFLTKYETNKFQNLIKNPSIAMTITDEKLLQTVQVQGVAREVDYAKEFEPTVKKYTANLEKYGWKWENIPLNHVSAGYYAFIQITPSWIRWSDFKDWKHIVIFEQAFT